MALGQTASILKTASTLKGARKGKKEEEASSAGVSAEEQEKANAESNLRERQGIASGLKNLSKDNKLTTGLLKQARDRATKAGVTDEQFESFLDENKIAKPAASKEEAAQNVMLQRQYGTGLGTLAAMQDPNYELGSGSALRQPARSIGPASGKFRRAARRLRRQGYGAAAQQMAAAGEMARMGEPSIDTPALRGQRMAQRIAASREAGKQDKIMAGATGNKGVSGPAGKSGILKKARGKSKEPIEEPSDFDKRKKERDSAFDSRKKARDNAFYGRRKSPRQTGNSRDPVSYNDLTQPYFIPRQTGNSRNHVRYDDGPLIDTIDVRVVKKARDNAFDGGFKSPRQTDRNPVRYNEDGQEMILNPLQTQEFRDANRNGIEDRREGIYRESDYIPKPKNWGKTIAL